MDVAPTLQKQVINGCEVLYFTRVKDIPAAYFLSKDVFLRPEFLESVEKASPHGYQFAYLVYLKNKKPTGFMACQIMNFKASESLNFEESQSKNWIAFRKWLAGHIRFNTLVVGSLLLTGEHGFFFDNQSITNDERIDLINGGIDFIKQKLAENGNIIQAIFVKDFFDTKNHFLTEGGYNPFQVEPSFIFNIKKEWASFDDYLNALSSKYRVRVKRAFKLLGSVEKKEFNEERILAYQLKINALHKNVTDNSAFNLVNIHENYFLELKRQLGDSFKLFGYFFDGELVGFYTTIQNGATIEAHFLGYDETLNLKHQIYFNFLLDIIRLGIELQCADIVFARTAHEIKSSIGAVPHELYLYLKHENKLMNVLFSIILKILSPREKWVARHPFK